MSSGQPTNNPIGNCPRCPASATNVRVPASRSCPLPLATASAFAQLSGPHRGLGEATPATPGTAPARRGLRGLSGSNLPRNGMSDDAAHYLPHVPINHEPRVPCGDLGGCLLTATWDIASCGT